MQISIRLIRAEVYNRNWNTTSSAQMHSSLVRAAVPAASGLLQELLSFTKVCTPDATMS
jgi:hypothetical protein